MSIEDAQADVSCLVEEHGPEKALSRYGLTLEDIEELMLMCGENAVKATTLLHGVLLGLALGEMRTRETA